MVIVAQRRAQLRHQDFGVKPGPSGHSSFRSHFLAEVDQIRQDEIATGRHAKEPQLSFFTDHGAKLHRTRHVGAGSSAMIWPAVFQGAFGGHIHQAAIVEVAQDHGLVAAIGDDPLLSWRRLATLHFSLHRAGHGLVAAGGGEELLAAAEAHHCTDELLTASILCQVIVWTGLQTGIIQQEVRFNTRRTFSR